MAQGSYPKPQALAIGPMPEAQYFLAACLFVGAVLYTSVGHAGASAYIAAMALFSVPAAVMRPTALALNILAASFGSVSLRARGFLPLARGVAVSAGLRAIRLHRRRLSSAG